MSRIAQILAASGVENPGLLQKGAAGLMEMLGLGEAALPTSGPLLSKRGFVAQAVGKGVRGAVKHPMKGVRGAVKHPVMAGLNALMMAPLMGDAMKGAVNSVGRGLTGEDVIGGATSFDEVMKLEQKQRKAALRRKIAQENRARVLAQNTMSLVQNAPNVAAQVMAGRRLPRGGMVIGGQPRLDLMQELAGQMADGKFKDTDALSELTQGM